MYRKAYYAKHRDKLKADTRRWELDNRTHVLARAKARYQNNREVELQKQKHRYANDPEFKEAMKERVRRWEAANPARVAETKRASEKRHPETKRRNKAKRRARMRGAKIENVEPTAVLLAAGSRCSYCHVGLTLKSMHMDHKKPLSRGGEHSSANITASCRSCNLRKANKTVDEFLARTASSRPLSPLVI